MPTPTIVNYIKVNICVLVGYYTAYSGNSLLTFCDNPLVPSLRVKISRKKKKVVPKCRQGITTVHCPITQKGANLICFMAEY